MLGLHAMTTPHPADCRCEPCATTRRALERMRAHDAAVAQLAATAREMLDACYPVHVFPRARSDRAMEAA